MQKNPALVVLLALMMILALAIPAMAEDNDDEDDLLIDDRIDQQIGFMGHSVSYNMDGRVNFQKQAGHFCNTGAEMKQTITGDGSVEKFSNIVMQEGYLQVVDQNDWLTAADAVNNLIVTTSIKLCSPPKYVYEDDNDNEAVVAYRQSRDAHAPMRYDQDGMPDFSDREAAESWDALTDQIWAVQVEANPGKAGHLHSEFDAAFGITVPAGSDLRRIGDFLRMSQTSSTDEGVHKRFIDISSPRSHAFLHEDMTVTGTSYVSETFNLRNVGRAFESPSSWRDLF